MTRGAVSIRRGRMTIAIPDRAAPAVPRYSDGTVTARALPSAIQALSRVDLNLLIALDSLLRERSVTQAAEVFAAPVDFDPATSEREFELCVSDYAASVVAAPLVRLTRVEAPRVHLRLQQLSAAAVDNAGGFLRDHDG